MKEPLYPSVEEGLYLHNSLIQHFGDKSGVLDRGPFESAFRSGYYSSLSEQASALLQSVAMNRPSVDGHKRVAFALTAVFLDINKLALPVEAPQGARFVETNLITGEKKGTFYFTVAVPVFRLKEWQEQRERREGTMSTTS